MLDILIVSAFLIYCVQNGFANRRKASQGLDEYFLAGRSLKGWLAGFSMAATQYAADTPLLVVGLIATAGIFSLWRLWVYAIAFLMMGFVLAPCWRHARILTDAEFVEIRYSGKGAEILRVLKAIHMGIIVNCTVLAMVLVAAVRLAEPFLPWHEWLPLWILEPLAQALKWANLSLTTLPLHHPDAWIRSADNLISIGALVLVTTLYSTTGGLRSAVGNDVVQFPLAMLGTLAYAWIIVDQVGGFRALGERITALYGAKVQHGLFSFFPVEWNEGTFLFLAVLAVQWFAQVNADGTGYLAQRTMGCSTDREARVAAVVFTVSQILFRSLIWLPIGIGLLILYPAGELSLTGSASDLFRMEREMTFVRGIQDLLPAGIRGIMLAAMIAAFASTVDTHLNWGGSYWTNDLYRGWIMEKIFKRKPGGRELVWMARASNLIVLVIATLIMANLGSIQGVWHLTLLFGSGLGVVLILRWVWYRINLWSEVTAACVSLIMSFVLLVFFPDLREEVRLLIMVAVSTVLVILVTLLTPPEPMDQLISFYRRVRPPGFWQPVVSRTGEIGENPLRHLNIALAATFLAAASIFLLLVGFGNLLLEGSSAGWFSYLFVFGGLALIPLWWRLGNRGNRTPSLPAAGRRRGGVRTT